MVHLGDALPWDPHIHLVMFVHRVRGLTPGLYAFERSPILHTRLQAVMHASFVWTRVPACPEHLRLFLLTEGDFRSVAAGELPAGNRGRWRVQPGHACRLWR